jgi:Domain of unknown function (DUF4536)
VGDEHDEWKEEHFQWFSKINTLLSSEAKMEVVGRTNSAGHLYTTTYHHMTDVHPHPPVLSSPSSTSPNDSQIPPQTPSQTRPTDCLSCRIIGTGALGATGMYALNQARAHQPGSVFGKRIMGGVGVLFLLGSVVRWRV